MGIMRVDPSKHEHPRRYRLALAWCLLGVGAGIAMTLFGLYLLQFDMEGALLWFTSFVLIGPAVIFLSAVGFATYLETLETQRYGGIYNETLAEAPPRLS